MDAGEESGSGGVSARGDGLLRGVGRRLVDTSRRLRERYDASGARAFHLAAGSVAINTVLGITKLLMGIMSLSFFTCMNALYTLLLVLARVSAIFGAVTEDATNERRHALRSSTLLLLSSVAYVSYNGWLYHHATQSSYPKWIALGIATVTFVEIGLGIQSLVSVRKSRSLPLKNVRTISLCSSIVSLVLTQAALLSIAGEGTHDPAVNAILGFLVGIVCSAFGIHAILRAERAGQTDGR